jgi:hypothetical protein
MSLSQCGRRYEDFGAALRAAQLRASQGAATLTVVSCGLCEYWHLVPATPRAVLDPFPPAVARQLRERDEWCQRCGRAGRLENHHRRAKSMGGSKARSHTQCACNGLRLCRACHQWVHEHPAAAREHGWIVRQGVHEPRRSGVTRCIGENDRGQPVLDPQWATCDGRWVHSPLETED